MAKKLSSLPVGALVKDANTKYNNQTIIWQVLEHGHSGDPSGTTALATRDIITLKCFDAKEAKNSDSDRKSYGNNRYSLSNLLQWLNSNAANWYTAKHTADAAPTSANVWVSSGTAINPYDSEAGFLTNFSSDLRNALQTVTKITALNTVTDGGSYENVSSKVFLLSNTEVGLANENNVAEGSIYAYYSQSNTNNRRKKNLANDAAKGNYSSASSPWYWWLRTPIASSSYRVRRVDTDGSLYNHTAYFGNLGVAPAVCISSNLSVSDSTDSDGCYVLQWNAEPVISTPSTSLGDKNTGFDITFSITDADGDTVSAVIALDGTTKQTISNVVLGQTYTFSINTSTFRNLSSGSHSITITATDSNGGESIKTITFNRVLSSVTISGVDGNLGNKWLKPTLTYQISDTGSTQCDVVEKIDGTTSRTLTDVELDSDITFNLDNWSNLSDEQSHTLVIEATNADGVTVMRVWTFTKLYGELAFYTNPITTDVAAKKINVVLNYEKTGNPTVKIEVTNNANAIQATWENATSAWSSGQAYEFVNTPSEGLGVAVRITVQKNANTERVYVNSLGITFA